MDWVSYKKEKPGHRERIVVKLTSGQAVRHQESRFGVIYDTATGKKTSEVQEWVTQQKYKEQDHGARKDRTEKRGDFKTVE